MGHSDGGVSPDNPAGGVRPVTFATAFAFFTSSAKSRCARIRTDELPCDVPDRVGIHAEVTGDAFVAPASGVKFGDLLVPAESGGGGVAGQRLALESELLAALAFVFKLYAFAHELDRSSAVSPQGHGGRPRRRAASLLCHGAAASRYGSRVSRWIAVRIGGRLGADTPNGSLN